VLVIHLVISGVLSVVNSAALLVVVCLANSNFAMPSNRN